jgi:hypothetical protein
MCLDADGNTVPRRFGDEDVIAPKCGENGAASQFRYNFTSVNPKLCVSRGETIPLFAI